MDEEKELSTMEKLGGLSGLLFRVSGMLAGVLCAVLMLVIGFFPTLLIIVLAALGWWIGAGFRMPMWLAKKIAAFLENRREKI